MHIGLDVGTSGVKAAAFDSEGLCLGASLHSYDFCCMEAGRRELDPEDIWSAAKMALADVIIQAGSQRLQSITVDSLGEAITPLSSDGKPLYNFIVGTDIRGVQQLERLVSDVGEQTLIDITGQSMSSIYSVNKILWLKEMRPDVYANAWKILNVQDFIIYRLSGVCVMDRSIASRTMLYDLKKDDWSDFLLDKTGIDRRLLPEIWPAGSLVDTILLHAAREIGADPATKIILGAHDHICNALGCRVIEPGWATNTTGTTEGITSIMDNPISSGNVAKWNISYQPFAVSGLYNSLAWHNTSGALLKWFVREFSPNEKISFSQLDRQCKEGPTGLLVLPHFSGGGTPSMDPLSKGAIVGLTLSSTRQEIYKAMMEGTSFELKNIMDCAENCGVAVDKLVVCGGGAKSPVWLQLKADILGRELFVSTCEHNGALGAAILGAAACKDHKSVADASRAMADIRPAAVPNPKTSAEYAPLTAAFQKLYGALAETNHLIH